MPDQVLEGLICQSGKMYLDCTAGAGGHSLLIAQNIQPDGRLISLDVDNEALKEAATKLNQFDNVQLIKSNYLDFPEVLDACGIECIDGGILLDLGTSFYQLTTPERGFSFQYEAPLDMRMNQDSSVTAYDLVNTLGPDELEKIFSEYGEERYSRRIAAKINEISKTKKIETTTQLANLVLSVVPRAKQKIHPATRVFQALRIAVNNELDILEKTLNKVINYTVPGTRIVIITFHSLEDRIVKQFFKLWSVDCVCPPEMIQCRCNHEKKLKIITKKPQIPSDDEVKSNPPSRSAKLRIAERI
jgi:16S rRNA (cytosine1402-N4)-methyltransferase